MSCLTLDLYHCYKILLRLIWAHLGLFRTILVFSSFSLIQTGLSSFRLISTHLGSFGLFKLIWALLRPFSLDSFQPNKYILEKITLIAILLTRCKCSHQFTIYEKKFKRINNCFMIIIEFIFWWQCEIHQRQFGISQFFCILFSILLS